MKKTLLALALMALVSVSASAVSVAWTSTALSFDGSPLKLSTDVSGYLIYLADGTFSSYDLTPSFNISSVGTVASEGLEKTSKASKMTGTFTFDFGTYKQGDTFGLLLTYVDGDGDTWYNMSSDYYSLPTVGDPSATLPDAPALTFNNNKANPLNSLSAGGGWIKAMVVPEPATGALALAGLALLFRRKRA